MEVFLGHRVFPLSAFLLLAACNPPADYALVGSAYLPSTHGEIDVEKIDREQILITVTLDHLGKPSQIEPGLTHYVVWFTEVGQLPVRQQALEYDAEAQTGRAAIPTTLREFDVMITAEQSDTPSQPSDLLITAQTIREK